MSNVIIFANICQEILNFFTLFNHAQWISHNVPAVYDGLAARIEKCVAFLGPTNCGGVLAWEWSATE
jgi:hypothetical protein